MSLIARHLEAEGLPTVILGAAKDIVETAGVPRTKLHGARHTAASLMLSAGEGLAVVKDILGHTTIRTTGQCDFPCWLRVGGKARSSSGSCSNCREDPSNK